MLPVKEIAEYARSFATSRRIHDVEEAESVAVNSLIEAAKGASESANAMGYYKVYARLSILKHFYNKKRPERLCWTFDKEYSDEDKVANIIEGMPLDAFEKKVINYRLQGYFDSEIAALMGKSQQWINKVRRIMKEKLRDLSFLYS